MIENIFDAPIPGQSLTDTPGNAKWEHPPQYTDVEEASEYIWERLHNEKMLDQIISFLKNDIPVEAITRMILFSGFVEGKWSPDVAILLSQIVFKQVLAIGVKANVSKMKMFLKDQSNTKFHSEFAKFKRIKNEGSAMVLDEDKAKQFVEEVKQELEEEPSGLMAKETE